MKITREEMSGKRGGAGTVKMVVEDMDDLWHLYNLISENDRVRTTTERKVHKELASGATNSQRVKLMLTVRVAKVDFDAEAAELRISGPNVEENPHVKLGAHHTLVIVVTRSLAVTKDAWDGVCLQRLQQAADTARGAELAVIVAQPGFGHLCLITPSLTLVRAKVVVPIPRKGRRDPGAQDRALGKFYDHLLRAAMRHVDFDVVKALLVAGPGFVPEEFLAYAESLANRDEDVRAFMRHRGKIASCKASSGFKHAVREVLGDSSIAAQLADTRAAAEVAAMDDFQAMLGRDPQRAVYGFDHVRAACDQGAVATLLVTDALLRSTDLARRAEYLTLVDDARALSADVHVFSSMHVSGEQLAQITGVAAQLRFPLPEEVLADAMEARAAAASDAPAGPGADRANDSDDDSDVGVPLAQPGAVILGT